MSNFPLSVMLNLSKISVAALAQLGERQTEDLKVPGSIPGGGTFFYKLSHWPSGKASVSEAGDRGFEPLMGCVHLWSSWL